MPSAILGWLEAFPSTPTEQVLLRGFTVCLEGYNCFKKTHPPTQRKKTHIKNKTKHQAKAKKEAVNEKGKTKMNLTLH